MKRVPFFAPLVMLMMFAAAAFATVEGVQPMTTQILTATPARTVVAAEFDAAVTVQRLSTLQADERITDGLGSLLAIAGHGNPSAYVQNLELSEPLSGTYSLDERDVANTTEELVVLGEPAIFHDLRIVSVGYRPLFRDSDGNLRAVTRLEVEVSTLGGGGINEKNNPSSFSSAFAPIYHSVVDNLDELYPELTLRPPGKYLVIVPTAPWPQLQATLQWRDWLNLKQRKGYEVLVATLQDIQNQMGSSNPDGIRRYIQQIYNQGDLEYVLLLGDVSGQFMVPSVSAQNPEHEADPPRVGDNGMQLVDGSDYLPDVLLGRVAFNANAQFGHYFTKVYRYETDPYLDDTHWFETGLFVAGNFSDNSYPVTPVWNVNWSRDRFLQSGCITDADTFYFHGPDDPPCDHYTQPFRDSLNAGACLVIYRGWAAGPGWQYPCIEVDDLDDNAMQTGRRNAAVFGIVCGSADYAYSSGQCFGEFMTTGAGAALSPNGAIVYYGASDLATNTRHNNAILAGITDAILLPGLRSSASIAAVGELEAYRQFPLEREPSSGDTTSFVEYYVFHVFNLLGDPETQLNICQPSTFSLTHPNTLDHGTTLVDVLVQSNGSPVQNAVVTIRNGVAGTVQTVTSDASGHAYVPCDVRTDTVAQLTVWKSQHFLKMVDIPVVQADFDPAITGVNWQDGDNTPNPGETVPFTLTVQYLGAAASDLNATLTSLSPHITIVNGNCAFGTLQPGQTGTSSQISIALSGEAADGQTLPLQVQFTGNGLVNRMMTVPVSAPDPLMISLVINDGGNGILEAGETANVSVNVTNNGHQNAGNLTATVYSWDNAVSFPDNQIGWGTVNVGQTVVSSDGFQVTCAAGVTPGRQVQLRYDLMNDGVPVGTRGQMLPIGVVTSTAPTGPDAYGYYAYEDIDAGFAATPTYNWIELDPAFGGEGGTADSVRDDSYFMKPLPAPFTFYGQTYSTIWICSNGWFSFEDPHLPEFRNWELPMTMAPWLLVSPFWDDLLIDTTTNRPTIGNLWYIWTRWDSPNRFIIMWRCYARECLAPGGNDCPEVFEAILEYNPSGDGSILLQYNDVVQVDRGRYSNYATVGIQNYYLQTGLNLTYANVYPASMGSLQPNRAIRITTQAPDGFNSAEEPGGDIPTEFALHDAYPNPFNPLTEIRFDLPETGHVTLKVYDVLGREQAVLVDEMRTAGRYQMTFDARDLPTGLYFARLESSGHSQVKKLMLVK